MSVRVLSNVGFEMLKSALGGIEMLVPEIRFRVDAELKSALGGIEIELLPGERKHHIRVKISPWRD